MYMHTDKHVCAFLSVSVLDANVRGMTTVEGWDVAMGCG